MLTFIQFHISDMRIAFSRTIQNIIVKLLKNVQNKRINKKIMKHFPNWNDQTKRNKSQ